jgi:hypothetical protein
MRPGQDSIEHMYAKPVTYIGALYGRAINCSRQNKSNTNMLMLLSPAKTMDMRDAPSTYPVPTKPRQLQGTAFFASGLGVGSWKPFAETKGKTLRLNLKTMGSSFVFADSQELLKVVQKQSLASLKSLFGVSDSIAR